MYSCNVLVKLLNTYVCIRTGSVNVLVNCSHLFPECTTKEAFFNLLGSTLVNSFSLFLVLCTWFGNKTKECCQLRGVFLMACFQLELTSIIISSVKAVYTLYGSPHFAYLLHSFAYSCTLLHTIAHHAAYHCIEKPLLFAA